MARMPRYVLKVEGERHGFVNMLSDRMTDAEPERFVASRVPHPLSTFGEVILDAEGEGEARAAVVRACEELVAQCDHLLASLGMSDAAPPLLEFAPMPKATLAPKG